MPLLMNNRIKYEFVCFFPPLESLLITCPVRQAMTALGKRAFVPIHIPHNEMRYCCENVVECLLD